MALWHNILLSIVGLIIIAILLEMYLKRGRTRPPLAKQFLGDDYNEPSEEKPQLGMEAIDMDVIRQSERGNKSAMAFGARDMQFWTKTIAKRNKKTNGEDK